MPGNRHFKDAMAETIENNLSLHMLGGADILG